MWASRLTFFASFILFHIGLASEKCVIAHGRLVCKKNPEQSGLAQMKIYDKDLPWPLSWFDPDDLMAFGLPNADGEFTLTGCARDLDPFPGIRNHPDPFLLILHACNKKDGELMRYNGTLHFAPLRSELGDIVLDAN